jgi:hypothetical protein
MDRVLYAILLLFAGSAYASPKLSADQIATIESGEVVVVPKSPTGGEGVAAMSYGLVEAPIARVWPVVRDCQHFHKFMPRTAKSELRERNGDVMKCYFKLDMPFPFSDMWSLVTSKITRTPDGAFHRRWSLIEGTYSRNEGQWSAYPWGTDGKKTLLVYTIDVDPQVSMPDFIIRKAQTGTLPDVYDAIRKRVRTLR